MRRTVQAGAKLTLREKFTRLRERMRNPEWRRFAKLIVAGKLAGIALVLLFAVGVPVIVRETPKVLAPTVQAEEAKPAPAAPTTPPAAPAAPAADAAPAAPAAPADPYAAVKPVDQINAMNTLWVLLGGFLVFGMQAGFTMLEAGFCRSRETVNVLVECVFDTCVCGLLHWGLGFALMFGEGNAFIGWHMPGDPSKSLIALSGVSLLATYGSTGIPIVAHFLFQFQ